MAEAPVVGAVAYRRLADELRAAIAAGTYPRGSQLPSENELMARHGVSRGTIRQSYAQLQHEGLVSSTRGSRRIVIGVPRVQTFDRLMSFSIWVRSLGAVPSARMIRLTQRQPTDDERAQLELSGDVSVFHIVRLRLISGAPAMIERAAYPEPLGRIIAAVDTDHLSITELLADHGYLFSNADHTIDAVAGGAEDARLLDVRPGSPLLRARRRTTDQSGRPLEWSDDRYRGDTVAFSVRNSGLANNLDRLSTRPRTA
jgi:GntR family transcriptional regulator